MTGGGRLARWIISGIARVSSIDDLIRMNARAPGPDRGRLEIRSTDARGTPRVNLRQD